MSRAKLERAFALLHDGSDELLDFALAELQGVNNPMVQLGNRYLLHAAARGGDATIVGALIDKGANVSLVEDWFGYTALHEAAICGHLAVVKLLLKHGADPNYRSPYGYAALDVAANHGRNKVVALLEPLTSAPPEGAALRGLKAAAGGKPRAADGAAESRRKHTRNEAIVEV